MKKKKATLTKAAGLWFAADSEVQKSLHHFLSPLELEAYNHRFTRFVYDLDGIPLELDGPTCRALLFAAKQHVKFFNSVLVGAQIKNAKRDPEKLAFLSSSPNAFKEIRPALLRKLQRHQITSMEKIAIIGSRDLAGYYKIGKTSVSQIAALFKKHECFHLFRNYWE